MTTEDPLPRLLDEAPFVARLARGLCRSTVEAEDLVQDTWVEALRHGTPHGGATRDGTICDGAPSDGAPRDGAIRDRAPGGGAGGIGSARGFLATVLRRQWLQRGRGEARRRAREAAVARPAAASTTGPDTAGGYPADRDLERLELQARLIAAVRDLPRAQAQAIALHYLEELDADAIARRVGITPSAVRSAIARGLATLRARLDADTPGGRERWMAALAPVGGLSMTTTGAVGAGLIMKKWIAAAGLVLLAGAGAWWAKSGAESPAEDRGLVGGAVELAAVPDAAEPEAVEAAADATGSAPGVARAEVVRAAAPAGAELDVRAVYSDGEPAIGAEIWVGYRERGVTRQGGIQARVEDDGVARFRDLPAGSCWVGELRGQFPVSVELVSGERAGVTVRFEPGDTVLGRVVNGEGQAIVGAQIFARPQEQMGTFGRPLGISNAAGQFRLRDVPHSAMLSARAAGHRSALEVGLEEEARGPVGEIAIELLVERGGVAFGGQVLDPAGAPVGGARVLLSEAADRAFEDGSGRGARIAAPVELISGSDGRFALVGGARRGSAVVDVEAPGWPRVRERVEVGDRAVELAVQLVEGGSVSGRVLGPEGQPLNGVWVELEPVVDSELWAGDPPEMGSSSNHEGRYRLEGLTPGPHRGLARSNGLEQGVAEFELEVEPGEQRLDLRLDPRPWIRGRVLTAEGEPAPGLRVRAHFAGGLERWASTDEAGEFTVVSLADGPYAIEVFDLARSSASLLGVRDVRPSDARLELRLEALAGAASVRGRIDEDTRRRFPTLELRVQAGGAERSERVRFDEQTGEFLRDGLAPGGLRAWLQAGDRRIWTGPVTELTAGETVDLGILSAPPAGRLTVRFGLEPEGFYLFRLVREDETFEDLEWRDGAARSGEIEPGSYRLQAIWDQRFVRPREVRVEPGRETILDLEALPAVRVTLVGEPGLGAGAECVVRVLDAAGEVLLESLRWTEEDGRLEWQPLLPLGVVTWVVSSGDTVVRGSFEVGPASEDGARIQVELRP